MFSDLPLRYQILCLALLVGVMSALGFIVPVFVRMLPSDAATVVLVVMLAAAGLAIWRDKRR